MGREFRIHGSTRAIMERIAYEICSTKESGNPIRVKELLPHEEQKRDIIGLTAPPAEIAVTARHRIVIENDDKLQRVNSETFQEGDRVFVNDGTSNASISLPLTAVREISVTTKVFEV